MERQASTDWVDLGKGLGNSFPITDIIIVNKKEKAGEYHVIENSYDGKKASFSEGGFLGKTTRYICFSRTTGIRGFVYVTDLKVLPAGDRAPLGFMPLLNTADDNSKSFQSRQLLVKLTPQTDATEAVTDLLILSISKKEDVPSDYKRLPEINGFSICYKVGPVKKKGDQSKPPTQSAPPVQPNPSSDTFARSTLGGKKLRSAVDGLAFKLCEDGNTDNIVKFAIGSLNLLSLQDVENQFDHNFSEWNSLVSSSS